MQNEILFFILVCFIHFFRYDLQSLCDSVENCVRALLGSTTRELSEETLLTKPHDNAIKCLEKVVQIQG